GVEAHAVVGDDARRFLAAMLERMQPKGDDRRSVGMIEDAEHAAMLAQPVLGEVEAGLVGRIRGDVRSPAHHCFGAGAKGAGGGTFLLIKASSFCLSIAEPFAPAVESFFLGASGAGVATGCSPAALGFESSAGGGASSFVAALARDLIQPSMVAAASSGSKATI